MSAVDWLVAQPWPIFLPTFLGPLALLAGLLLAYAHHLRRPPRPRKPRHPLLAVRVFLTGLWVTARCLPARWKLRRAHGHECGCICADRILPCALHKGRAREALHGAGRGWQRGRKKAGTR